MPPASNSSTIAPRPATASRWRSARAPRPAASCQQHLSCHGALASIFSMALRYGAPASNSSATAPRQQQLRYGALASNKPHPAEKSTPVWLAIWRIWAGFANSQLRRAIFHSIYLYACAHPHCCYLGSAAQTDANLSAHLHRLPTPPPYLRRMRLSPGRMRRSCKSPRARIPVLGTSGAHWPVRWPRFVLTERLAKS